MHSKYLILSLSLLVVFSLSAQQEDFSHINFDKVETLVLQNRDADLDNLPQLVRNLTDGLETDVERFRAIYLWTCYNIKNDYDLYAKNKRKRERFREDTLKLEAWNEKFKSKIFKTLLKRKRTICTGYAYMVASMCQLANIKCVIVNGFAKPSSDDLSDLRDPNHSWNAVKLNDKWYLCDPTWASGVQDSENGKFKFQYNDGLFLVSPRLFALNHFPVEEQWFLMDNPPSFQEFIDYPIIYNDAFSYMKVHSAPKQLFNEVQENYEAKFQYVLKEDVNPNELSILIDDGSFTSTLNITEKDIVDNDLNISYIFEKRGQYDLHLICKNKYLSTYVFKVSRLNAEEN